MDFLIRSVGVFFYFIMSKSKQIRCLFSTYSQELAEDISVRKADELIEKRHKTVVEGKQTGQQGREETALV